MSGENDKSNYFSAERPESTVLSYKFKAAKTRPVEHEWRYFVAGGESLKVLEQYLVEAQTIDKAYADLAASVGAKSAHVNGFDFAEVPPIVGVPGKRKWVMESNPDLVQNEYVLTTFVPDYDTPGGSKLAKALRDISGRENPEYRFSNWIDSFRPKSGLISGHKEVADVQVEKIGDEWIIKVPVKVTGGKETGQPVREGWVVPPGAIDIGVSDYFKKLEQSGSLRARPKQTVKPN